MTEALSVSYYIDKTLKITLDNQIYTHYLVINTNTIALAETRYYIPLYPSKEHVIPEQLTIMH